ncbi:MAG TPA: helix-turn-helix domain-containing protein [Pseudonocardia sp.]|jgi:excisionase family DNA binding protein
MTQGFPLDEPLLTITEVAAALRVSKMTIYRLVHAGELPAIRIGKSFRVQESALRDYLKTVA